MVHSLSHVSINLYILTGPGHRTLLEQLVVECPCRCGRQMQIEGPVRVDPMPEGYTRVVFALGFGKELSPEARSDEICEYAWRVVRKFIDRLGVGMAWRLSVDNRPIVARDEFGRFSSPEAARSPHSPHPGDGGWRVRKEKAEQHFNF
ncbi:hypothetical protein [Lyngbya sp. CCY1209]|uniref:hypothetical protein n=1 Tax=Lyngbya sp. CCY1209 TaxID=2886103 RepID=UPI002D20F704|nr:hypothetical protein [Lyngbya sp. CCY1209]MEB3883239.1 hypothetical protein [Lyngbya sp. CCY1209]